MSSLSETRRAPESNPEDYERLERATGELNPPFALVDLESFKSNEKDLVRRAELYLDTSKSQVLLPIVGGGDSFPGG